MTALLFDPDQREIVDATLDAELMAIEPTALYARRLHGDMAIWVIPMMFTTRMVIGSATAQTYDDLWCFDDPETAVIQAVMWDPATEPEPNGWHRHPPSGRRRRDGDPTREYVSM